MTSTVLTETYRINSANVNVSDSVNKHHTATEHYQNVVKKDWNKNINLYFLTEISQNKDFIYVKPISQIWNNKVIT
jgi:hypothetical protein